MSAIFGSSAWTVCYLVLLLCLSVYGVHRYWIVYLFLKNRRHVPRPAARFVELPAVTVQLPIFNERYVAERLLRAVCQLDYPADKLEIQVLDDSTDDTQEILTQAIAVEAARRPGLAIHYLHRTDRTGFKAGALECGLRAARGEFIFILDADFVPRPGLLRAAIDFFTDPMVGMVQSRWGHLNRTYSLLTRAQAMFLDSHFLLEQTARSRSGRFFNFNGTAGIWRKTCIEAAGGWQHDTLTEDLDLSYRAQLAGWQFVYLTNVVTPGELPVDMNGFKNQQHRWAKGSIQTCKKLLPRIWRAPLPLALKVEATMHLTSYFCHLILLVLCVLLMPAGAALEHGGWLRFCLFDLPIFFAGWVSTVVVHICTQRALHRHSWPRQLLLFPMVFILGVGLAVNNAKAVLEALFNRESGFVRTPKYGIQRRRQGWRHAAYRPLKSILPAVELAFAAYFTYFCVHAAVQGQYSTLPFIVLLQAGFCYVAFCSLSQWLPRWPASGSGSAHAALPSAEPPTPSSEFAA
ncbi:MAG: glycosyltransferase [Verrucomicrobia bacterium]|nr:glycosyltransferase [Verrucomicrobiota bacterium]